MDRKLTMDYLNQLNPEILLKIAQSGYLYMPLSKVCHTIRNIMKKRSFPPITLTLNQAIYDSFSSVDISRDYLCWALELFQLSDSPQYRRNPLTVALDNRNLEAVEYYYKFHRKLFISMSMVFNLGSIMRKNGDDIGYDAIFMPDDFPPTMTSKEAKDLTISEYIRYIQRTYGLGVWSFPSVDDKKIGPLQWSASIGIKTFELIYDKWNDKLLENTRDPYYEIEYRYCHLHDVFRFAVQHNNWDVIQFVRNIPQAHIDIDDIVFLASQYGNLDILRRLMNEGYGLHYGAINELLSSSDLNVHEFITSFTSDDPLVAWSNWSSNDNFTPWHRIAAHGDLDSLKRLQEFIQRCPDHIISKVLPPMNAEVFHYAVLNTDDDLMIKWLYNNGCSIQMEISIDSMEYSSDDSEDCRCVVRTENLLRSAIEKHCIPQIDWLLDYFNIDMTITNEYTEDFFDSALDEDDIELMKYVSDDFLRNMEDVEIIAAEQGCKNILKWMVNTCKLSNFIISYERYESALLLADDNCA